jgi:hypothetical protein
MKHKDTETFRRVRISLGPEFLMEGHDLIHRHSYHMLILEKGTCILKCHYCNHGKGARGAAVFKTLRYNPEGRGIDSRWCHWNFY